MSRAALRKQTPMGNDLARHFLVMLSGSVAARMVFFLALPIISRHFSPSNIGEWQLYLSVVVLLSAVITFRYEIAIVLPERNDDAASIFWVCIGASALMSLLWLGAVCLLAKPLAALLGIPELWPYLFLTPVLTLAFGVEQACSYWLTRQQAFLNLAPAKVIKALATVGVPLGLALTTEVHVSHLIVGSLVGQLLSAAILVASLLRCSQANLLRRPRWEPIRRAATNYKNYPIYVAPYGFLGQLGKRLTLILLAVYASSHVAGLFSIALQLTFVPIGFVAATLNQVLYPKIARQLREGNLAPFVSKVLASMVLFAAPPFVYFAFFAEDFLPFALGESWAEAAPFVTALSVPAFMLLLTSWLDRIFDTQGKQRLAVILQFCYDVISISLLFLSLRLGASPIVAVWSYCLATAIYNALWLAITYRVAGFPTKSLIPIASILFVLVTGSFGICWLASNFDIHTHALLYGAAGTLFFQFIVLLFWNAKGNRMSFSNRWKYFWEQQNSPLHGSNDETHYASYAKELRFLLGENSCDRVLEIGCGDGALFQHLGFRDATTYQGVDVSSTMIDEFKRKHPDVQLAVHDGHTYEDGKQYDLIFSNGVLQYFTPAMLREHFRHMEKMLAPRGIIVCGSIPWRIARTTYLRGGFRDANRKGLWRYFLTRVKFAYSDAMGRWYMPHELTKMAGRQEFTTKAFGSLHYPYRFHMVIGREKADRQETSSLRVA